MPRRFTSTRVMLRAFQHARKDHPDDGITADLDFLQAKDLDLSVRLGALLAFDALLISVAVNPISASPGAPLSLDAATHPWEVLAISLCILLLGISGILCLRAIMLGEEFDTNGIEDKAEAIVHRMFAAYCTSVDFQARMVRRASQFAVAGGVSTLLSCAWIMVEKIWG